MTQEEPGGTQLLGVASDGPKTYLVHEIAVANRSLTDRDAREKLFQLLGELADVIDSTSGADVQVATIRIELNAAAGVLGGAEEKAKQAGAGWSTREEDF